MVLIWVSFRTDVGTPPRPRRRCGQVPAQMWFDPGADMGQFRRKCGLVPAHTQLSSVHWLDVVKYVADVGEFKRSNGRVPVQMWASPGANVFGQWFRGGNIRPSRNVRPSQT
jgi:hypothetical protein